MLPICLALSLWTPAAEPIAPTALAQDGFLNNLTGDAPWHTLRWQWFQAEASLGDPDGYIFDGAMPLNENLYGYGNWGFFSEDGLDYDLLTFGVGYHDNVAALEDVFEEAEWFARGGFQNVSAVGFQESGFEIAGGLRAILAERIEAELTVGYRETFDADFFGSIRGEYELSRNVALTARFEVAEDEILGLGFRFYPTQG